MRAFANGSVRPSAVSTARLYSTVAQYSLQVELEARRIGKMSWVYAVSCVPHDKHNRCRRGGTRGVSRYVYAVCHTTSTIRVGAAARAALAVTVVLLTYYTSYFRRLYCARGIQL